MQIELLEPESGLEPEMVRDMMMTADGTLVELAVVELWTPLELALAYDWAARLHLAASDNEGTGTRPRPWFVAAVAGGELTPAAAVRDIVSSHGAMGVSIRKVAEEMRERWPWLGGESVKALLEDAERAGTVTMTARSRWVFPGRVREMP